MTNYLPGIEYNRLVEITWMFTILNSNRINLSCWNVNALQVVLFQGTCNQTKPISFSSLVNPNLNFSLKWSSLLSLSTLSGTEQGLIQYLVAERLLDEWFCASHSVRLLAGTWEKMNKNSYHWGPSSIIFFNFQVRVVFVGTLFCFSLLVTHEVIWYLNF